MNTKILSYKNRLDSLFNNIDTLPSDPEFRAHWAKYLCVLVSGFIEFSVRELYSEYARKRSSPNIANYVERELRQFQNAKMGKILELAQSFSSDWGRDLSAATEGELGDAVNSIVAIRHLIVHGKMVGITVVRVSKYYKRIVDVIDFIESQCT